jgi:hypothetical protein
MNVSSCESNLKLSLPRAPAMLIHLFLSILIYLSPHTRSAFYLHACERASATRVLVSPLKTLSSSKTPERCGGVDAEEEHGTLKAETNDNALPKTE